MNKVKLQFMVVPELLAKQAYVPNPVRVKIIDPEAIFLTGLLGESGRKLVKAGVEFYFTKTLAKKLIDKKIAVEVKSTVNYPRPIPDGGCSVADVPKDVLLQALEDLSQQQKGRLKRANLLD